jgi:hypothetical protein
MTSQETTAYFTAFNNLSTELMGAYDDAVKKADPDNLSGTITALQAKLIITTVESLTETVKQFRKTLG